MISFYETSMNVAQYILAFDVRYNNYRVTTDPQFSKFHNSLYYILIYQQCNFNEIVHVHMYIS